MTELPESVTAPAWVAYCCRCGTPMTSRLIADKPRRVCPACDFIHFVEPKVGVGVMVVQNAKLLLVRRTMEPEKGKWSLPAGYVDIGVNPATQAVQEAKEETNLQVEIIELVDVYHNPPAQGGAAIFILYKARVVGGELRAGDDADRADFFALDALPELAFASTRDAVHRLSQG